MLNPLIDINEDFSEKFVYDHLRYPICISCRKLSDYPDYTVGCHWHGDIELIALLSGSMDYKINNETVHLESPGGIIVNSAQMHYAFSDLREECRFICALIHPSLLCINEACEKDYVLPILKNPAMPYFLLEEENAWQNKILKLIRYMYENSTDKALAPLKIQTAFLGIWSLLYENISPEQYAYKENTDLQILKNMVGYIQKNYDKKITLSDIAASGFVGKSKCCRLFSEYCPQQTPVAYLNRYRLSKSLELLLSTDMSITEIAMHTGFGGASYFTEAFKKWTGMTPTAYRKSHGLRKFPVPYI